MKEKFNMLSALTVLLTLMIISGSVQSYVTEVSEPGRANKILSDFTTPIIRPSESGRLSLNITNRYDGDFLDMRFTAEIYAFADLDHSKDIADVERPPVFRGTGTPSTTFELPVLPSDGVYPLDLIIETQRATEKGVYFVRFAIEFVYEPTGNHSVMRSRGYFTDEDWAFATRRPGTGDAPYYSGSINITHLEVNGIIPDTSFSVKTPIPRWPQYLLGGFAAFFGILAVMLYMQEEYNSFPWLEKILDQWAGKFNQFRRSLEHRLRDR